MASLEEENAQLRETIVRYEEKEASQRTMFDEMKSRLKEALDDKKEFEIEFLQLQKNYLKVRNQAKDISESKKTQSADSDRMYQLIAAQAKAEEELKVLREDNDVLKRQNADLSEQYREQAERMDQNKDIDKVTDDFIDSY